MSVCVCICVYAYVSPCAMSVSRVCVRMCMSVNAGVTQSNTIPMDFSSRR